MASQLRIAVVSCLLLFVLMEDAKPVLAGKGKQSMKERESLISATVSILREHCS